jgi:hypothetical protein
MSDRPFRICVRKFRDPELEHSSVLNFKVAGCIEKFTYGLELFRATTAYTIRPKDTLYGVGVSGQLCDTPSSNAGSFFFFGKVSNK